MSKSNSKLQCCLRLNVVAPIQINKPCVSIDLHFFCMHNNIDLFGSWEIRKDFVIQLKDSHFVIAVALSLLSIFFSLAFSLSIY